jgi:hypothetical protein
MHAYEALHMLTHAVSVKHSMDLRAAAYVCQIGPLHPSRNRRQSGHSADNRGLATRGPSGGSPPSEPGAGRWRRSTGEVHVHKCVGQVLMSATTWGPRKELDVFLTADATLGCCRRGGERS